MERAGEGCLALVVCWSPNGEHLGEVILVPSTGPSSGYVFGRSEAESLSEDRVHLTRRRPGSVETRPLEDPGFSPEELSLRADAGGIEVRALGQHQLITHDGQRVWQVYVARGQTLEISGRLLLLCVWQPLELPGAAPNVASHPFGRADPHGLVGESPAAWRLRERITFMAERRGHLLLLGASGTGKELAARALHALSPRRERALVARNAAVFPAGLVDAELFGNAPNYPNAGSPDRPGLIGQAHGSTLFLDEVGELPHELQAHLLRVLDSGGEYQRLGESRSRSADLRIVGATARAIDDLRLDFAARFRLRLELPPLDERRQDIPLIARQLLLDAVSDDPLVESLLGAEGGCFGVSLSLMRFLVTHQYRAHVRELDALLWRALGGGGIDLRAELAAPERPRSEAPRSERKPSRPPPTASEIVACLERHGGVRERAWRDLGLTSRHALKRLIRKYDLRAGQSSRDSES